MAGGIICGDGNDLVYIISGVVPGAGGIVAGIINGGSGFDGLGFSFNVVVPNPAAAQAIANALATASPAGGSITIAGVTYTWTNFEVLYNLLTFSFNEEVVITIPVTRRINANDLAAPVAVYCAPGGVELWTVNIEGAGSFAFSVASEDVEAGTTVSGAGVTFASELGGVFRVTAISHDGKPYSFTGSCN